MSDFIKLFCDFLPVKSNIREENNELRNVLDKSLGEFMDNKLGEVSDNIFLTTATGGWLDCFGNDYGVRRKYNESDDDYRDRIVFEKLEYLNADNLQDIYGLTLYCFINQFDASENTLTSDNPYVNSIKMTDATGIEDILKNKFILNEELIFMHNNKIDAFKNIKVKAYWNDNANKDLNRPSDVDISLFVGDEPIDEATLSNENNWEHTFENMPIYTNKGNLRPYTIVSETVTDYDIIYKGNNVIYDYNPETITLTIVKEWNKDGHTIDLPEQVKMTVKLNNTIYKSVYVNSDNEWTSNVDVPVRYNGSSPTYTWSEEEIPNFTMYSNTTSNNVTTIINKYYTRPPSHF